MAWNWPCLFHTDLQFRLRRRKLLFLFLVPFWDWNGWGHISIGGPGEDCDDREKCDVFTLWWNEVSFVETYSNALGWMVGIPHLRHCHDMFEDSMHSYITVCMSWQCAWYHALHASQHTPLWSQVTGSEHVPLGKLMPVLFERGPEFNTEACSRRSVVM